MPQIRDDSERYYNNTDNVLGKIVADLDWFQLLSGLLIAAFTYFLFFGGQGQLNSVWTRGWESPFWIDLILLPLFGIISTYIYSKRLGAKQRRIFFILIALPIVIQVTHAWVSDSTVRALFATLIMSIFVFLSLVLTKSQRRRLSSGIYFFIPFFLWILLLAFFSLGDFAVQARLNSSTLIVLFVGLTAFSFICFSMTSWSWRLLLIIPAAGLIFNHSDHPVEYSSLPGSPIAVTDDRDAFIHWMLRRGDVGWYARQNRPYPVIIVSSEGGGGFAAAHASAFLQSMHRSCESFGQHIFALVGVSGGAVGNAEFHDILDREHPSGRLTEKDRSNIWKTSLGPWVACKDDADINLSFVSQDHLAALLSSLLFDEFVRRIFWLPASRNHRSLNLARSFEQGISEKAYLQHFWTFVARDSPEGGDVLVANGLPALIQVSTELETGRVYPFAPFRLSYLGKNQYVSDFSLTHKDAKDITISSATVASASFPYVTPAAEVQFKDPSDANITKRLLIDGGYADNSGNLVARLLARAIRPDSALGSLARTSLARFFYERVGLEDLPEQPENCRITHVESPLSKADWSRCDIPFSIVHIVISSRSIAGEKKPIKSNFFTDPIVGLNNVRGGRSRQETALLVHDICNLTKCRNVFQISNRFDKTQLAVDVVQKRVQLFQSVITPEAINLPLGWTMPSDGLVNLRDRITNIQGLRDWEDEETGAEKCLSCISREFIKETLFSAESEILN